jgi:hypothetical protein
MRYRGQVKTSKRSQRRWWPSRWHVGMAARNPNWRDTPPVFVHGEYDADGGNHPCIPLVRMANNCSAAPDGRPTESDFAILSGTIPFIIQACVTLMVSLTPTSLNLH